MKRIGNVWLNLKRLRLQFLGKHSRGILLNNVAILLIWIGNFFIHLEHGGTKDDPTQWK